MPGLGVTKSSVIEKSGLHYFPARESRIRTGLVTIYLKNYK